MKDRSRFVALAEAAWDEAAPMHRQATHERLVESFRDPGFTCLHPVLSAALERCGVRGADVAQLNCNNGRDLLSVKRLGAGRCVGFDIAGCFVEQGRALALAAGLDCELLQSDVYRIPASHDGRFDIVFLTAGALCFMPDLDGYFAVAARLLRPGGAVLIHESHPITDMFELDRDRSDEPPAMVHSYFDRAPRLHESGLDYHTQKVYDAKPIYYFHHTMSDIVMACLRNGLRIEHFEELDDDPSLACRSLERMPACPPLGFLLVARLS